MSFRDLRNFSELLRILGCPKQISLESFRNPNFPLMSELLIWLTKRFDPEVDLPDHNCNNEQERVLLIRSVAYFLATKTDLKLNTKRLYEADGHCIRELLKIAMLLHEALSVSENSKDDSNEDDNFNNIELDINDKIEDLKQTRMLASEITAKGAILHDLMEKEVDLQIQRNKSLSRQLEISTIEEGIKNAIENLKKETERINQMTENISSTEANLDQRLERKRAELERSKNRLQTLKKVRPAFLDEFSALEKELQNLYIQYVSRYRTVIYLENLVEDMERAEAVRMEQQQEEAKKLAEQMQLEDEIEETGEIEEQEMVTQMKPEVENRLRVRTGVNPRPDTRTNTRIYGSLHGDNMNSESSIGSSSDTESDDILFNGENINELGLTGSQKDLLNIEGDLSTESDVEIETQQVPMAPRRPTARATSSRPRPQTLSDDDF